MPTRIGKESSIIGEMKMARNVQPRFRSFLPGAGFDANGNPKQGKTRVVGVISVTSYEGGSGESLKARDIGLSNIDFIQLRVSDEASGEYSGGAPLQRNVVYSKSTGHFYLHNEALAGDKTGVANAGTETVEYVAEGDSIADVELL
jgi:hypothetical protein